MPEPTDPRGPEWLAPASADGGPPRWIVYVDLDAYYVSCELRERPELAGRPVIVGPPPSDRPSRGVVLSASYEARAFGVKSALPVRVAAGLCPEAVWIPPDFPKYERVSEEVRALLRRHAPDVVPFSIDEAAVSVAALTPEEVRALAERMQRDLRESLGLPASFGCSTSRAVAKIATDRAKPGGIVVVPPERIAEFLAPLPVRSIPGVGPKTEALLGAHGVRTIGELAAHRPGEVGGWIGEFGRELVSLARGRPVEGPLAASGPRSRSTDRTFPVDVADWPTLDTTVRELAASLAASLDHEGVRYAAVGVGFRWADFSRSQRLRTLPAAQEGTGPLTERAVHLARELWDEESQGRGRPIRTLSVRAERLTARAQRQAVLDEFPPPARPTVKSPPGVDGGDRP